MSLVDVHHEATEGRRSEQVLQTLAKEKVDRFHLHRDDYRSRVILQFVPAASDHGVPAEFVGKVVAGKVDAITPLRVATDAAMTEVGTAVLLPITPDPVQFKGYRHTMR